MTTYSRIFDKIYLAPMELYLNHIPVNHQYLLFRTVDLSFLTTSIIAFL